MFFPLRINESACSQRARHVTKTEFGKQMKRTRAREHVPGHDLLK